MSKKYPMKDFLSEWTALDNARQRCHNEKRPQYPNYGGRGIKVADEWRGYGGFQKFMEHIGPKPSPELTLDRIDSNGNYEPGNVRWLDEYTNKQVNKRPRKDSYEFQGQRMSLRAISTLLGFEKNTVKMRIDRGDNIEEATADPYIPRNERTK